ncbi:MAG: tail fiber protein [Alphaproteobacteria bacterium]|nr:tail fiber protein [Alphaproteobacteria bacterium]MCW5739676.1 tail fiber protein [Alphaproteobacteria bacterium]
MTVSSSTSKVIGTGNDATTSWPFTFAVLDETHLTVVYTDAEGADSTLDPSVYTVALNADQAANPGGTVTYAPAIATGTLLTILRVVPYTQATDIKNQGGFYPEVIERALDLLAMQLQQVREQQGRALKLSPSQAAIGDLNATDADRASKFVGFDPDGELALYSGVTESGAVSLAMAPVVAAATLALAREAMGVPAAEDVPTLAGDNEFTGNNVFTEPVVVPSPTAGDQAIPADDVYYHVPSGYIVAWPTSDIPAAFLLCDGSAVSRATYPYLFDALVTDPGFTAQTFTVTIASPGVVTKTSHGFTGGERLRLSTTGALPTGLTAGNEYFVIYVDADTFRLATTEANAAAGTAINTSGGQSGTHSYTRSLYGLGDGSTTFNLPDLRNLFPRGKAASGRALGSYEADDNKAHAHGTGVSYGVSGSAGLQVGANASNNGELTVASVGSEARPKNRALNWIIKT